MKTLQAFLGLSLIISVCACDDVKESDDRDYQEAQRLFKQGDWRRSLALSKQLMSSKNSNHVDELKVLVGANYRYLEYYDSAYNYFQRLINDFSTNSSYINGWALYQLGDLEYLNWSYFRTGEISQSADLLDSAATIFYSGNDLQGLSAYYYRRGSIAQLNEEKGHEAYFIQSMKYAEEAIDTLGIMRSYTHLASSFRSNGAYDSAIYYQEETLVLSRAFGRNYSLCHHLSNLGYTYLMLADSTSSKPLLDEAFDIASKLEQGILLSKTHLYLGRYYKAFGNSENAREHFSEGLSIATSHDYANFVGAFERELSSL